MDMLSTPTAIPTSASPLWMECAILRIAIKPEEHNRFTVEMGTWCGIPAAIAAAREMYRGDGGWQVPSMDGLLRYNTPRLSKCPTYANVVDLRRIQTSFLERCLRIKFKYYSNAADDRTK